MTPTLALNDLFQDWFFRGPSATDMVEQTDGLFMFLWWNSVFWFVLLMGLTAYFVVRYRRVPGKAAQPSPSHHALLETVWTVVPTIVLVFIFVFGFWGYMDKVVPAGDAMELNVRAWKWGWAMTYPDGTQSAELAQIDEGGNEFPVFALPENTNFRLRMISQDVIHSFWIPDLRTKMDVLPNRYSGYAFKTPELDDGEDSRDMWVFCAEYCGDQHAEMAAIIRVVRRPAWEEWLGDQGGGVGIDEGEKQWKLRCAICHTVDGSTGTGPTWLGGAEYGGQVYGYGYPVTFTDGTSLEGRDADYIRESILDPNAKIVGGFPGSMPPFDGLVNADQLESLVMYYQSLSDRGPSMDDGAPAGESGTDTDASTSDDETGGEP